jgi:hypothetical protein
MSSGDRIKLAASTDVNGVPAAEINKEHIIEVIDVDSYKISSTTVASSTGSGGGASITIRKEISAGECDATSGYGYGMGLYGVGLYGVGKTSYNPISPRIWSGDFFGTKIIMTPGVGGKLYEWDGDTDVAPTVVSNSPASNDWVVVYNNIVITVYNNVVTWSDSADQTVWTPAADNFAGTSTLYSADKILSMAKTDNEIMLFTKTQVWRMTYIGKPFVFSFEQVYLGDGIAGNRAFTFINEELRWWGNKNYYVWRGGAVQIVPNNTIKEFVLDNLHPIQRLKMHGWANNAYGEAWFFYPVGTEITRYVVENTLDGTFTIGTWDRTAAELNPLTAYPFLISSGGSIYQHEYGYNDDTVSLGAYITSNFSMAGNGDSTIYIMGLAQDAVMVGDASLTVYTKLSPQSSVERTFGPYTIEGNSSNPISKVDFRAHGRLRKYKFSSGGLDTYMASGDMYEFIEKADDR